MEEQRIQSKEAWRIELLGYANEEWKELEKILLAVVGGTLAGSITFLTSSNIEFTNKVFLSWSWAFLCLSLLSLLLSYLSSERFSCLKLENIKKSNKSKLSEQEVVEMESEFWARLIVVWNLTSAISAVAGIIFLAIFGYLNLSI